MAIFSQNLAILIVFLATKAIQHVPIDAYMFIAYMLIAYMMTIGLFTTI